MPLGYTLSTLRWGATQKGVAFSNSLGIESFYREHYDQGVVIRLLHPSSVFFQEKHVLVHLSLLHEGYSMDAVHLPLIWFFEGFEQSTYDGPPVIIFISPITLGGRWDVLSSSLGEASRLSLLSSLDLLGSPFFTNLCNFPFRMSSSIYSFRSLQSSV